MYPAQPNYRPKPANNEQFKLGKLNPIERPLVPTSQLIRLRIARRFVGLVGAARFATLVERR